MEDEKKNIFKERREFFSYLDKFHSDKQEVKRRDKEKIIRLNVTASYDGLLESISKRLICHIRGRNWKFSSLPMADFIKAIYEDTDVDENYSNSSIVTKEDGFIYTTISGRTVTYSKGDKIEINFGKNGSYYFASFCLDAIRSSSWNIKRKEHKHGSTYKFYCPYCNQKGTQEGDFGWSFIKAPHECYDVEIEYV